MFDRDNYKLSINEKKQNTALRFLLFIIAISFVKALYDTSHNSNQEGNNLDHILWVLILLSSGTFCLIYGINALTIGNLVKRRMNEIILGHLITFIEKFGNVKNNEDAISKATKLIGIIMLIGCTLLFVYAFICIKSLFSS